VRDEFQLQKEGTLDSSKHDIAFYTFSGTAISVRRFIYEKTVKSTEYKPRKAL